MGGGGGSQKNTKIFTTKIKIRGAYFSIFLTKNFRKKYTDFKVRKLLIL